MKVKKNRMTRYQFEKRLGGNFIARQNNTRANGRYQTYKDYSLEVQERRGCFCRDMATDRLYSARTWGDLAGKVTSGTATNL